MVKDTIKIFGRVKPTKSKLGLYEIDEENGSPIVSFTVPRDISDGFINNKKEVYKFQFERVFDQQTKQDEIFQNVAQPVVDNVLSGYNGTIFAYGQTGSGKTFTITGGAERYIDRGIIPRTLSYVFECIAKSSGYDYTMHISYLEIYNESGYDLLDPKHEASKLEDLPKVSLMEDDNQNIHLKNLSTHRAGNEEEALNLLFLGDTNRMIAETPMNQASTRSHCIFTVHITSRETGSATIRRSKLHLVDLAGSERVSKTGVNGILLKEAKYINLSLHYLEQVIVSLSEKNRSHIPYRNSMMTSVLRDSLGGNCMTTMIATMSVEKKNLDESISTCRFAQRVALIKNDALLNEELDPKLMIQKLKAEISSLKAELAMVTGEQRTDALSEEDQDRCQQAVNQYLEDVDPEATLNPGADMRKIQYCYKLLKRAYLEREARPTSGGEGSLSEATPRPGQPSHYDSAEANKLKGLLVQRDNEINILVNMLKKEKKRAAAALAGRPVTPRDQKRSYSTNEVPAGRASRATPSGGVQSNASSRTGTSQSNAAEEKVKRQVLGELSMGRQEAFEIYRRDYPGQAAIEENKSALKQRYAQAKALGERVNGARTKITKLKASIEQHRMSRVMQGLVDPDNPEPDDMELDMRHEMEQEKQNYKGNFTELRTLKTEIEHLQHLLEKSKVKLMKDFEMWWAEQAARAQEQQNLVKSSRGSKQTGGRSAWNTPPVTPGVTHQPQHSLSHESSQSSLLSEPSSQSHPISRGGSSSQLAPLHPRAAHHQHTHSDTSGYSSFTSSAHSNTPGDTGGIVLTGDAQADADIMAFVKARQTVASHMQKQGHR